MRASGQPDALVIINGPEDGTEFPINGRQFALGNAASCAARIRLDRTVQPVHVQAVSGGGGYRIRCATGAPAYVNGKRAGVIRSRRMRHGDVLRAGYTELILECAPDGFAKRSHGIGLENDLVWAIRKGVFAAYEAVTGLLGGLLRVPMAIIGRWKFMALCVLAGGYLLVPPIRGFVNALVDWMAATIRAVLS